MAVSEAQIKADLLALYNRARNNELTDDDFAGEMAAIIRNAILSAQAAPGIPVQVSTATGTGATTGPGPLQ